VREEVVVVVSVKMVRKNNVHLVEMSFSVEARALRCPDRIRI